MKNITKSIIAIALIFNCLILFSQVNISMNANGSSSNSAPISNCGIINFQSHNTLSVTFYVNIEKHSHYDIGSGHFIIYGKKNSSTGTIPIASILVSNSAHWFNSSSSWYASTSFFINVTMNASDFDMTGGLVFGSFAGASSCSYHVVKEPGFNITPSNLSITCEDASPKTFSVTNVNNITGTKTYKWQLGNGWTYPSGGSVPNEIITSSNSITVVPSTFPPSNVKVATILNGNELPFSICTVSLNPIENRSIIGEFTVCSSEVLSIDNLNSNESVSWSSSNNSLATISSSNNQATVYANGDGIVTITATISDLCGQQLQVTKLVTIGVPTGYDDANIEVHPYPGNVGVFEGDNLHSNYWTRMWMTNYPGGTNWNWTANYSMILYADSPQPSIKPLTDGYMTIKVRKTNQCGNGSWVSKDYFVTPYTNTGGGHIFLED